MNKNTRDRFSKDTIETLAKRAGLICANPDCKAPTSGPHSDETKAVNLGEAAHIKGAELGSARYDASMSPAERASITNGIWLCSRCHTLVDRDERRFTVDVLYAWKRQHESEMAQEVAGGWERKAKERHLKPLEGESSAAYQIALDQPEHWEYLLTIELMRSRLSPVKREFDDLKRGLIFRPSKVLDNTQFTPWFRQKINDLQALLRLLMGASIEELPASWGSPGQPGDAVEILRAIDKINLGYRNLLDWEIDVYFTKFSDNLEPIRLKMQGWAKHLSLQVEHLAKEISKIFDESKPSGIFNIEIVFTPPPSLEQISNDMDGLLRQGVL
jgi:hypothetical protein